MVKALHQAGIEVILDVVFNHTAESNKGIRLLANVEFDDDYYYWKDAQGSVFELDRMRQYAEFIASNEPKMGIGLFVLLGGRMPCDGFRFDLATVLGRETPELSCTGAII